MKPHDLAIKVAAAKKAWRRRRKQPPSYVKRSQRFVDYVSVKHANANDCRAMAAKLWGET